MDYKTFSKELENIKKELINYTNSKTKKNVTRVEKLVNDYLDNMSQGKYSLKSYKAKIIHNELEHHRTEKELMVIVNEVDKHIDTLLDDYFKEYLELSLSETSSPTKLKDLKDFSLTHRKERQEVVNKKNALEKEIIQKNKEYDTLKEEKLKLYNEAIQDIKSRLQTNLNKINEKNIRDYSEFESRLLEINDKQEIDKLKEKIKEIRLQGLSEEYNAKVQTYEILLNEELSFIDSYESFLLEINTYNNLNQRKIIDFEQSLNKLTIELDNKEKMYDAQTEIKYIEDYENEINELIRLLNVYNSYINDFNKSQKTELDLNDKLFIFDFVVLNLYYILVNVRKRNIYDSLSYFIVDIINLAKSIKESTLQLHSDMNKAHEIQTEKLVLGLTDYEPKKSKKVTKEEFVDNVKTSLTRYYVNFYNEVDKFNLIICDKLMRFVKGIVNNYDRLVEHNYAIGIIPNMFLYKNNKYDYYDINGYYINYDYYITDDKGNNILATNSDKNDLIAKYSEDLKLPNKGKIDKASQSLSTIEKVYAKKISLLTEEYNEKVVANEVEARKIEIDYIRTKKDKEIRLRKSTKDYISSAKTLYLQSIKVL